MFELLKTDTSSKARLGRLTTARGVVDTRTVVFYLSLTFLFLFLTLRVVESRRWK